MALDGAPAVRVPVRRNHSTYFAAPRSILAVRAEGHYSWIALRSKSGAIDEYFCERSISDLAKLLAGEQFMRSIAAISSISDRCWATGGKATAGFSCWTRTAASVPVSRANVHLVLRELEGRVANLPVNAPA